MTDTMECSTCGPSFCGSAFLQDILECITLQKGFVVCLWVGLGCVFET